MGSGDREANAALTAFLAPQMAELLRAGGVIAADQDLRFPGAEVLPLPEGVKPGRYFLYRKG